MNCAVRICCTATLSILISATALANAADIGKAAVVVPNAISTSVEKEERSLQVGADVFKDDIVQTGNIGAVMLQFNDKTTLKIFPNSKVKLDNYVYDSDKSVLRVGLNLLSGAMRIASGGPHTADKYQLRTPQATIGIRGTVIHIVSDDERTIIEALHGTFHACATTGSACRTVSATDDMNTLRMWSDGRIELARVQRDLGVRSAQGSSDVAATKPILLSQNVAPTGGLEVRNRGGRDANRQLPVNLDQSPGLNPPVVALSTVSTPANAAPGTGQRETATSNLAAPPVVSLSTANTPANAAPGTRQGGAATSNAAVPPVASPSTIGNPADSEPGSSQGVAATSSTLIRSVVDTLFEIGPESEPSHSNNSGHSSGGAPTPEVNASLGILLAGATFVFLRRKRSGLHGARRPPKDCIG